MSKRIYLTFVGQLREFDQAVFSHTGFIEQLKSAVNFDVNVPVSIYLSVITWDESYSIFPKQVRSFVNKTISKEYIVAVMGDMFKNLVVDVYVDVVSKTEAQRILLDSGIVTVVDEFHSVAYLHERSLDAMLHFEKLGGFKFDLVILTRPDIYLRVINIEGALIANVSDSTVYYKNSNVHLLRNTLTPTDESAKVKSYYEQYVDQFNVFGRVAFYAYGLMFRYIIANNDNDHFFYTPSLHFWVDRYLEKFRISKAELNHMNLNYVIIRPTYRLTHADIDFSMGDATEIIKKLAEIETYWQNDIDREASYHGWLQRFRDAEIEFVERKNAD